jgi:hypothetical protein
MSFTKFISGFSNSIVSFCSHVTSTTKGKAALTTTIAVSALLLGKFACDRLFNRQDAKKEFRIEDLRETKVEVLFPETTAEDPVKGSTRANKVVTPDVSLGKGDERLLALAAQTQKAALTSASSLKEEDKGALYDNTFNSVPGTCFEIGAALSILNNPGDAGMAMDISANQLFDVLIKVYDTDLGNRIVKHNGKDKPLKQVFNEKLLAEIKPTSDQIGRCIDKTLTESWLAGSGIKWLQQQLTTKSNSTAYSYQNMLTKIRMISAFGTVIRELMSAGENEKQILAHALGKKPEELIERHRNLMRKLRHSDFDDPKTRSRFERPPIVDGKSVGKRKLQDAAPLNLGFGQVYGPLSFEDNTALGQSYKEAESKYGRQGIEREGQPIKDLKRPGLISEVGLHKMPQAFENTNLKQLLNNASFEHGTGVNRWQLNGTYARQSWANGLPSAGSHSGGTVDILLALDCLSHETLDNNEDVVLQAGLLIASFMNFGGYHSFNETFPIAQAYSKGEIFEVNAKVRSAQELYTNFTQAAQKYTPKTTGEKVKIFEKAYVTSLRHEQIESDLSSKNGLLFPHKEI